MTLTETLASLPRRAESEIANPLVEAVLRSPGHRLLSRYLLLLSYVGRKSGRRYTTPATYRRTDDGVVLFTPAEATNWWRNFRGGYPVDVLVRGEWHRGRAAVDRDEAAVLDHLRWMAGPLRRAGRLLGVTVPSEERLRAYAPSAVLVRVSFDE